MSLDKNRTFRGGVVVVVVGFGFGVISLVDGGDLVLGDIIGKEKMFN